MNANRTPVLYVIDRAPRFRRQLVEALRQEGEEAYGVATLAQALRVLALFPRRFRVLLDLGPGSPDALARLADHPRVSEVAVLSSAPRCPRPSATHAGGSAVDGASSGVGTVVQRARKKQVAIVRYPKAQGHAGCSQSTVSLDVQR